MKSTLYGIMFVFMMVIAEPQTNTQCNKINAQEWNPLHSVDNIMYTGYLRVKDQSNSALSFIFYGAQKAKTEGELKNYQTIVWLNGLVGDSSQIGNFIELGPLRLKSDVKDTFEVNVNSWNGEYNLLFLDQPIGAGFSYHQNINEIPTTQDQVVEQFNYAMTQFLTNDNGCIKGAGFTDLDKSNWFLFGVGYATKYVVSIAKSMIENRGKPQITQLPFKGIGLGDPVLDSHAILGELGSTAFNLGLIDSQERSKIDTQLLAALQYGNKNNFDMAHQFYIAAVQSIVYNNGGMNFLNYLKFSSNDAWLSKLKVELDTKVIKNKLKFSEEIEFEQNSDQVHSALNNDVMKRDCFDKLNFVLQNKLKVLIFQSQNNLQVPISATIRMINSLTYTGSEDFQKLKLESYKINDRIVGYKKTSDTSNLWYYSINNSGYYSPIDQPIVLQSIANEFIKNYK